MENLKKLLSASENARKILQQIIEKQILQLEDRILNTADSEYHLHPPTKYFPDGFNLFLRMKEYKDNYLLFLKHPDLEYTNNLAERGLRKFKRKFKQAVTFRSNESVAFLCNSMRHIKLVTYFFLLL